ncbi:hypothetical protein [Arthrobacter bambusae]|uniref:hypothetical protein n=1 Tax=Arthrobacter bambusae TaxID=1338426 RepID=UPI002784AB6E|nr:hypothetical protein [Arthrobacter bambusae]MDQ0030163.1 putative membrane protein [Arthrobacter bambusae]MDQ0097845.1 putative membrane protein [Arthrobacter bambusae]
MLQFIGIVVLTFSLPASFSYYSGSSAMAGVVIGVIVLLIGLIALLVGIGRAASGLDYLVSVAPDRQMGHVAQGAPSSGDASNVPS